VVHIEYIYATLLLYKAGKEVNEENLKRVLEAAGVQVDEVRVKSLVAAVKSIDIGKVLEQSMAMPMPAATAAPAAPTTATSEEKKEKPKEEKEESKELSEEALSEGFASLFG
jgi:large subunit ribosomal protein L12